MYGGLIIGPGLIIGGLPAPSIGYMGRGGLDCIGSETVGNCVGGLSSTDLYDGQHINK